MQHERQNQRRNEEREEWEDRVADTSVRGALTRVLEVVRHSARKGPIDDSERCSAGNPPRVNCCGEPIHESGYDGADRQEEQNVEDPLRHGAGRIVAQFAWPFTNRLTRHPKRLVVAVLDASYDGLRPIAE
jgi:hypothetical protein